MIMKVTSNHYRKREKHSVEIKLDKLTSRRLVSNVEISFNESEPLQPSEYTLLCFAHHYETIRRSVYVA